jgi:uncharacterized protein YjbI with pentapeptide repeats
METFATPTFPGTASLERIDQEVFRQILQAHQLWLTSEGKEGRRANLKDTDLRHIVFAGANLVQASLRGVNLESVDLRGAMLQEADFTEAKLTGANLSGLELRRVNFASANLDRAILDQADLAFSNFLNAHLNEASLREANLERTILRQGQLARANFENANLTDANGRESNFTGAKFIGTLLARTDMRDARFDYAEFVNTRFQQTPFKGSTFNGVSFTQADFKEALEISPEYRSAAYKEEKAALEGQLQQIKEKEIELEQRTREREAREASLLALAAELRGVEEQADQRLAATLSSLKKLAVAWLLVTLLVLGGVLMAALGLPFDQLNLAEIAVVACAVLVPLGLFGLATLRVRAAVRHLSEVAALRERKLFPLHTEIVKTENEQTHSVPALSGDVPQSSDELTLNLPEESTRRRGLFGKKA